MANFSYRADVDGLRAIAVLPVLFFHVGMPGMSGGYVGVDVFFVISGFLITSILHREVEDGRFSIVKFYERRVRRLWPALVVVIAASIVGAWLLLLPSLLKDFGQSLVAVTVFASNVLFFSEAGYFDGPAELKPLLHTWSLAVEEQFYLFFPPLLWAVHRVARRWVGAVLVVLAALSFVASVLVLAQHQSAVFYLLPFRAWELLFGALLAVGVVPPLSRPALAHVTGLVGLLLILGSVALFTAKTPFPGASALAPVLGTALVIHAGGSAGALSARILSAAPLVFIGKISYSLYLWHWPLIVFARTLTESGELPVSWEIGLIVLSIAAGALSWRFVEAPFRDSKGRFSARVMFAGAALVSVVWFGVGVGLHKAKGAPGRLSPEARLLAEAVEDFQPAPDACGAWPGPGDVAAGFCKIGDPAVSAPSYFLWGDSHAGILVHGADLAATQAKRAGLYSNLAGCAPLVGIEKDESVSDAAVDARCAETNARVWAVLEKVAAIDTVILVSRWAYYAEGGGVGADAHNVVDVWNAGEARDARDTHAVIEDGLVRTVDALTKMGKRVFVLRQVPEVDGYKASTLANALVVGGPEATARVLERARVTRAQVLERQRSFERVAPRLAAMHDVTILDPWALFCDDSACHAVRDGKPLYFDNNHVTTSTSRALAPVFAPAFSRAPPAP